MYATTTGIVEQVKIIPQLLLGALLFGITKIDFRKSKRFGVLHVLGAVLLVLSSFVYGFLRISANRRAERKRRALWSDDVPWTSVVEEEIYNFPARAESETAFSSATDF